jgi:hypothetical protein
MSRGRERSLKPPPVTSDQAPVRIVTLLATTLALAASALAAEPKAASWAGPVFACANTYALDVGQHSIQSGLFSAVERQVSTGACVIVGDGKSIVRGQVLGRTPSTFDFGRPWAVTLDGAPQGLWYTYAFPVTAEDP